MAVPYWVQDAVFYQIFPDRFRNGDPDNDPPNLQPWGEKPTLWGFHGGDLRGVIQKIDYLLDLGINAIYFNPIFQATSNHRYNISDYFHIDRKLGSTEDFLSLLDLAHQNHIRVIIDGVFNHCGRGFFAFNDVLENHSHSPYIDWFHLNNVPPDAYSPGDADDYAAWWNFKSLPKFNTDNPKVRNYIFDIARHWIQLGVDGWRLDVPNEINDLGFWEEFRGVVKSENPDAYLVGEIWDGDPHWVGEKSFDGLMNYPLRAGIIGLLKEEIRVEGFSEMVQKQLSQYEHDNLFAMYNPLGSHDTIRIKNVLDGNREKTKLAFMMLMAYPGAPAIYYGDEIGLEGGEDPDCRRAFPWDENQWDRELLDFIRLLISLRRNRISLRRGTLHEILVDGERGGYGFGRKLEDESTLIFLNASNTRQDFSLNVGNLGWSDGRIVKDLINHKEYMISGTDLNIDADAWSVYWLG